MSFVGVDIQAIDRARPLGNLRAMASCLFSEHENSRLAVARDFVESFYGLFCAREAVFKALFPLTRDGQVEVKSLSDLNLIFEGGRPVFCGTPALRSQLDRCGYHVDVSISHSSGYAVAFAVADIR